MKYLILSVDTGIDDALALAYAAGQKELSLLGVTVSYGMAPVEYTYRNTKYILSVLGAQHIPVYAGSHFPVQEKRSYNGNFHGMDGAANLLGQPAPAEFPHTFDKDAVSFLLESVQKYKEQLILVTTGPLTDLAEAIQKEPETLKKIGHIFIMGGALTCPGNSSPYAEANIKADPYSSKIVAESQLPITFIGLDVTRKTLLNENDILLWKSYNTLAGDYFYKLLSFYIKEYQKFYPYLNGCALHDPLAVACACHPELIHTLPFSLTVSLDEADKGRMTENIKSPALCPPKNVALKVDSVKFKKHFMELMEHVLNPDNLSSCTLYIAGPMLFYPNGSETLTKYAQICYEKNITLPKGKTPLLEDDSPKQRAQKHRIRCLESLSESSFILANLAPFRGTQPDSGTLFELGYAYGKGKNCGIFCDCAEKFRNSPQVPTSFEEALSFYMDSPDKWIRETMPTQSEERYILIFSREFPDVLFKSEENEEFLFYQDQLPILWIKYNSKPTGNTLFEQIFPTALQQAAAHCHTAFVDLSFYPEDSEPPAQASFLCGYLYAKEKPFYILSDDLRPLKEKVGGTFSSRKNCWIDKNGNMIENFSLPLNLMLATTANGVIKL